MTCCRGCRAFVNIRLLNGVFGESVRITYLLCRAADAPGYWPNQRGASPCGRVSNASSQRSPVTKRRSRTWRAKPASLNGSRADIAGRASPSRNGSVSRPPQPLGNSARGRRGAGGRPGALRRARRRSPRSGALPRHRSRAPRVLLRRRRMRRRDAHAPVRDHARRRESRVGGAASRALPDRRRGAPAHEHPARLAQRHSPRTLLRASIVARRPRPRPERSGGA